MPFEIVRSDITKMNVDAIVNSANPSLLGVGGVDGAIHRAAGPELLEECKSLGGCETGHAKITKGYRLPCKYVIHTVGPIWQGGNQHEKEALASCYSASLRLAMDYHCESIAFPLISTGAYGYPKDEGLKVATDTIRDFLLNHEMNVFLVIFDRTSFAISKKLYARIQAFIDNSYIGPFYEEAESQRRRYGNTVQPPIAAPAPKQNLLDDLPPRESAKKPAFISPEQPQPKAAPAPEQNLLDDLPPRESAKKPALISPEQPQPKAAPAPKQNLLEKIRLRRTSKKESASSIKECFPMQESFADLSLEDYLKKMDEGFRDMLIRKIDERGMTDAECYKKANVDRKLFNKIKTQYDYRPSKSTVLAFAVALRLSLDETEEMLKKAGFSLSHSSKFDLIVEFFIIHGNYDIFEINEALFSFDQKLLGSVM